WNNVTLRFSSADPNVSGVAPELKTYFLNYNTQPPSYKRTADGVSGKVTDNTGEPLPGATVNVQGTSIGTVTDMQGNYSITIPNNATQLTYSFIGFNSQTLPITGSVMNVALQENQMDLEEVVVVGYGTQKKGKVIGSIAEKSEMKIRGTSSLAIPTEQVETQTTVNFEIKTPYSIKSDNKSYTVDIEFYDLTAFYQYYCVPKIDKDAFLIAHIVDWEKYSLLEGEATIFFEETYVGKTLLDVRNASDTLEISLGRDKKVSVTREKIKDFTTKQFIGNKKEETRTWKTTVKNNKNQEINMIVLDQIPVSTAEDIEVNALNTSNAKHDLESGEIKWEFTLKPSDKKELDLKYSVKYPKFRNLVIE
ncbi:MAG: mucoidy inhibitor MuiA family protein, partial [Verrucomicrobia bacterium]|nr:mucoidy inhibitor MuiA family protein [Prolixibacteraceae bacterium]